MIVRSLMDKMLHDEDLLGYSATDIGCRQCSGMFCNSKCVHYYKGTALIICPHRNAGREVIQALAHKECEACACS